MRGAQTLFAEYHSPLTVVPKADGIGRSKNLIDARDKRMTYRYYYYQQLKRRSYQDIISLLCVEFDLSELRVTVCLNNNHPLLKQIMQEKPDMRELRKLYPWLIWD